MLGLVPSSLEALQPAELPGVRWIFSWGEAMGAEVAQKWRVGGGVWLGREKVKGKFWGVYGVVFVGLKLGFWKVRGRLVLFLDGLRAIVAGRFEMDQLVLPFLTHGQERGEWWSC